MCAARSCQRRDRGRVPGEGGISLLSPASRPLPLPSADHPRLRLALLGGLGIAYAGYAWVAHGRDLPVMCPYRRLTGHRCPLCGATTALSHLLRGEPRAALRAHPLAPPAALVALIWYLYSAFSIRRRAARAEK